MTTVRDWSVLPLAPGGRSLVEASAGTGKTWTIAALYLRLLLEQGLSPRQIVVSTFTKAAAAELSERLRGKLLWALAQADKPTAPGERAESAADGGWLHRRWAEGEARKSADVARMQAALAEFDSAPISTLHALCVRILAEHPFAAGALFRGRSLIDVKSLERALVDDLWRVVTQGDAADELVVLAHAICNKDGAPERLTRKDLEKYISVLMRPEVAVEALPRAAVLAGIGRIVGDPSAFAETLRSVLNRPGLLGARSNIRKAWSALADALESADGELGDVLCMHHAVLGNARPMTGVNKDGQNDPDVLRLLECSEGLATALPVLDLDRAGRAAFRRFLVAAQRWCQRAMQARLNAANQSTFDQLLQTVHVALQPDGSGRRALADALHAAWPVALVDEFQDTDPLQYGILDEIYTGPDRGRRGRLVLIGDPKQAIYRFRGGDIQTYERAKQTVAPDARLTLDTNYRSSRAYVEAVNRFHEITGTRLGPVDAGAGIEFQRVQASSRCDGKPLRSARTGQPVQRPLVFHELDAPEGATDLEDLALCACAGQIVTALSEDGYRIGDAPLRPGDIAVLLPNHGHIAKLSDLLRRRGVPCAVTSLKSVFDSDAARELRLVLHAALHADNPRSLRAALATRLWGASLAGIQQLRHDAAAWDGCARHFHELHAALASRGPLAVVGRLLELHAPRLLATVQGERILTDLRHLGELLQQAWVDCGAGGERLMAWFADQMQGFADDEDAADARALRLESDAERVQLMTLHVSKGLEFGVVFLPLMWKHKRPRPAETGVCLLATEDGRGKYLVENQARQIVKRQEFEERFRMLYVALTRAVHACHVWSVSPQVSIGKKWNDDVPLNTLELSKLWQQGDGGTPGILRQPGWQAHEGLRWAGDTGTGEARSARPLPSAPSGPLPMRHSFSTLGIGRAPGGEEERAADDELALESSDADLPEDAGVATGEPGERLDPASTQPLVHPELTSLAWIAGREFGNAVHAIFEHRLPGVSLLEQKDLIERALRDNGVRFDARPLPDLLAQRLQAVVETPLGKPDGPRLIDLAGDRMRAEMEFNYLLDGATLQALRAACEAHGEPQLVPTRNQTLAGLMNGKIDLLFEHEGKCHVLDYKGNRLGSADSPDLRRYVGGQLEETMHGDRYRFQALLYTIATERYLRERLGVAYRRDRHLGDCWYLFIRAVGLQLPDGTACGVWHHRFNDEVLDAVQAVLGPTLREAA